MKADNVTRPGPAALSPPNRVPRLGVPGAGALNQEQSVLRWGGLAGMLSPILTILTAITLFGFVPAAPASLQGPVLRYPAVSAVYALGETFSLASIIFGIPYIFALYHALRGTSRAPALWGLGLGFLGLAAVAVQAVPRVVFGEIAQLYHAPGATPQDQATLALIWQATQAIFDELDTAAVLFQMVGYVLAGIAMLRHPAFGKRLGGIVVALALAGLGGLYLLGIASLWYAPLGLFVLIILPILLGWRLFGLSRAA